MVMIQKLVKHVHLIKFLNLCLFCNTFITASTLFLFMILAQFFNCYVYILFFENTAALFRYTTISEVTIIFKAHPICRGHS